MPATVTGKSGTGELPWPGWSKRMRRARSANAASCGSHMFVVLPSEPNNASAGASSGPSSR